MMASTSSMAGHSNTDLLQGIQSLCNTNDQLQKTNKELMNRNEDLSRQIDLLKNEKSGIQDRLDSAQRDLQTKTEELRLRNLDIKNLQTQSNAKSQRIQTLEDELTKKQSLILSIEAKNDDLLHQLDQRKQEIASLRDDFTSKLVKKDDENIALKRKVERLETKVDEVTNEKSSMAVQFEEQIASVRADLTSRLSKEEEKNMLLEQKMQEVKAKLMQTEEDIISLTNDYEAKVGDYKRKLDFLTKTADLKEREQQALSSQLDSIKIELIDVKSELERTEFQLTTFQRDKESLEEEYRLKVQNLHKQLQEKDDHIFSQTTKYNELLLEFDNFKKKANKETATLKNAQLAELAKLRSIHEAHEAEQRQEIIEIRKQFETFSLDLKKQEDLERSLTSKLNTEEARNAALQQQIEEYRVKLEQATQEITALTAVYEKEVDEYKGRLDQAVIKLQLTEDKLHSSTDSLNITIKSLNDEKERLIGQLKDSNEKSRAFQTEAKNSSSSIEALTKKIKILEDEKEKLMFKLENIKASHKRDLQKLQRQHEHELDERKKQVQQLKCEYQLQMISLNEKVSQNEKENFELSIKHDSEVSKLTDEVKIVREEIKKKEAEINSLRRDYQNRESELEAQLKLLNEENIDLKGKYKLVDNQWTEILGRISALSENMKERNTTISDLRKTLKETEASRVNLLRETHNLRSEVSSLNSQLESAKKEISTLSEKHSERLSNELNEVSETQRRLNESELQARTLQRENMSLRTKLKELEYQIALKCDTITKNEAKIIELQQELRSSHEKMIRMQQIRTSTPVFPDAEKSRGSERSETLSFALRKPKSMSSVLSSSNTTLNKNPLPTPVQTPENEDVLELRQDQQKVISLEGKLESIKLMLDEVEKVARTRTSEMKNGSNTDRLRNSQKKAESILNEKTSLLDVSRGSDTIERLTMTKRITASKSDFNLNENSNTRSNLSSSASASAFITPHKPHQPAVGREKKSSIAKFTATTKTSTPIRSRRPPDMNLP